MTLPAGVPLHAWMRYLPDDVRRQRSICELALPCCHNAGAREVKCIPSHTLAGYVGAQMAQMPMVETLAMPFATQTSVCQCQSISELLHAGVRALDFRVGMHNGILHICHTVVCGLTLQDALEQVLEFLQSNDGEIVAVLIKRDWEHRDFDTTENWDMLQATVLSILDDLLVLDEAEMVLPLEELCARGRRALVLLQVPDPCEVFCGLQSTPSRLETSWLSSTKSVDEMLQVLNAWRDSGRIRPERGRLKLLEVALPGLPRSTAPRAMEAFRNFIRDAPLAIGVNLDFPDAATISAIIGKNWAASAPPEE